MQKLAVLQSMWAMEDVRIDGLRATIGQAISNIVEAGFDGISTSCSDWSNARETARVIAGGGLVVEGISTCGTSDQILAAIEIASFLDVHHLNIQPDVRPRTVSEASHQLDTWLKLTEGTPFPVLFETHRDRLTNDLCLTLELLDQYPNFKLLADLSHYVVSREFRWPVSTDDHSLIHRILDRSWAMHGRVSSQHQVQIELSFPQHQHWVEQYRQWWRYGMDSWRRRSSPQGTFCFTCELGPQPYAISGPDGLDTTDRWSEAQMLRSLVRDIWNSLDSG